MVRPLATTMVVVVELVVFENAVRKNPILVLAMLILDAEKIHGTFIEDNFMVPVTGFHSL